MKQPKWVFGDGGPLIVLQKAAIAKWEGATDFENSLMEGGYVETDYDVICSCKTHHLHRYERDMLVLDDSEFQASVWKEKSGAIVIFQPYFTQPLPSSEQLKNQFQPTLEFEFEVVDSKLRSLVGAENGRARTYGFAEISVAAGARSVMVYESDDALAVVLENKALSHGNFAS